MAAITYRWLPLFERRKRMAVWKRYNGKRVKGEGPKGKGTWIVEFRLRGHYVKQAIPEARTGQKQNKHKRRSSGIFSMTNTIEPPATRLHRVCG
jgi:hypothetical protein